MGSVKRTTVEPTPDKQITQARVFRAMARRTQSLFVSGVEFGQIFRDQTADGTVNIAEIVVWVGFKSGSQHPTPTYPGAHFTRGARRADFAKIADAVLLEICQANVDRIVRSLPAELDAGVIERIVRGAGGEVDALRGFLTDKEAKNIERVVSAGHLDKNAAYLASFHRRGIERLLFEAARSELPRIAREVEEQAGKKLLTLVTQYGHAVTDEQLLEARTTACAVEPRLTTSRSPRTRR